MRGLMPRGGVSCRALCLRVLRCQIIVKPLSPDPVKLPAQTKWFVAPDKAAMEGRKEAISIRLNAGDLRNLRKLAQRMGVRNSDVIRFALKSCIARLEPLLEADVKGKGLVPVFVEAGADMARYLDLDATRIDAIINDGVGETGNRVERADIHLLAGIGVPKSYARLRLVGASDLDPASEDLLLMQSLRKYLYEKYVFDHARHDATRHEGGAVQNGALPQ
jgi:hypothetical protein